MRSWVPVSAVLAPVALAGGWTVAAARQPESYDSVRDTISALAADGATDPWIMTTGLAVLGAAHVVTAAGLTDVGRPARLVHAAGGVATMLVAVFAQPSAGHEPAATAAFVALALWPAFSRRWPARSRVVTGVLLLLLGGFAVSLRAGAGVGLTERVVAGAEALVPLGYALALRRSRATAVPVP